MKKIEYTGFITKINSELSYGFINIKNKEEIFFSEQTQYCGTQFNLLKLGQKVKVTSVETSRGLFASSLTLYE